MSRGSQSVLQFIPTALRPVKFFNTKHFCMDPDLCARGIDMVKRPRPNKCSINNKMYVLKLKVLLQKNVPCDFCMIMTLLDS